MQKVQDLAQQNYTQNMEYFEKEHEKLHNKLLALETLLNEDAIKQKYDLEYKDNYFDVVELQSNNLLYSQDSNKYGTKLCDEISMKKSEQVCQTFYDIDIEEKALKKANESSSLYRFANIVPLISYYNENMNSNMHFKQIYKFMFFGLGLATHVQKIMDKIKPSVTFLIEDDVELFRLSLFTCNYKDSMSNTIAIFSVGENIDEHNASVAKFYQTDIIFNQYLKFSLFSNAYQNKVTSIQQHVVSRSEKCYTHELILNKNKKVLKRAYEKYNFVELNKKENETFFHDKPILVLGAGPSLGKNIQWLKENQDNFIIIAVFASLKVLIKHKISPDIAVHMDEQIQVGINLVNSLDNLEFLNNTMFLFSASIADIFFEKFDSKNIFLFEDRSYYKQKKLQVAAASIGELSYSIALILNPKETYLLGLDLAIAEDGSTHSKEHIHSKKIKIDNSQNIISTSTSLRDSTIKIKGNLRQHVLTTPLFAMSIPLLNRYTKKLKSPTQHVFNLCDGAYFNDTIPLHTEDMKPLEKINKKELSSDLNKLFNKYATSSFSKEELEAMEIRKNQLSIFRKHIENFEYAATSNTDLFTSLYKIMIHNIMSTEHSELKELLVVYIYNISGYILDFFNTQELKNTKRHTKKMKKIIVTQFKKIINSYEDILNNNTNDA